MKDKFIPKTTSTDFSKIRIDIINPKLANKLIEENHYSGASVKGVVYHIGIFYENTLKGVAQYGYGIKPTITAQWVEGTRREEFVIFQIMEILNHILIIFPSYEVKT